MRRHPIGLRAGKFGDSVDGSRRSVSLRRRVIYLG